MAVNTAALAVLSNTYGDATVGATAAGAATSVDARLPVALEHQSPFAVAYIVQDLPAQRIVCGWLIDPNIPIANTIVDVIVRPEQLERDLACLSTHVLTPLCTGKGGSV